MEIGTTCTNVIQDEAVVLFVCKATTSEVGIGACRGAADHHRCGTSRTLASAVAELQPIACARHELAYKSTRLSRCIKATWDIELDASKSLFDGIV